MKLRAFQRVIAAMVKQTPPLLPGEVDIDFLLAIGAQREPFLNRYEGLFLLRWRGHRFPPNRPLRLHVEVNSDRYGRDPLPRPRSVTILGKPMHHFRALQNCPGFGAQLRRHTAIGIARHQNEPAGDERKRLFDKRLYDESRTQISSPSWMSLKISGVEIRLSGSREEANTPARVGTGE